MTQKHEDLVNAVKKLQEETQEYKVEATISRLRTKNNKNWEKAHTKYDTLYWAYDRFNARLNKILQENETK